MNAGPTIGTVTVEAGAGRCFFVLRYVGAGLWTVLSWHVTRRKAERAAERARRNANARA